MAFICHGDCLLRDTGMAHPESPLRSRAIEQHVIAAGVSGLLRHEKAPLATHAQLEQVDERAYIGAHLDNYMAMLNLVEANCAWATN